MEGTSFFKVVNFQLLGWGITALPMTVLLANGIWISQFPVPAEPGCLGLVTKLVHAESGEWQALCMVVPLSKADPQGYGSAFTYARRYALAILVGLVTVDDDAESVMGRGRASSTGQNGREQLKKDLPRVGTQMQQEQISDYDQSVPQAILGVGVVKLRSSRLGATQHSS